MAERGGFEPPVPCGTTAFEAAPINQTLASLRFAIDLVSAKQTSSPMKRVEKSSLKVQLHHLNI